MATFQVKATITVEGDNVRSKADVKRELQVMLDDYFDNNSTDYADIVISIENIVKEK